MARPIEVCFPRWNPRNITWTKIHSLDKRVGYKALRNSSSGFIKNKIIRKIILEKSNYRCVECGATNNLQVDHIISVYLAHKHKHLINILNTKDNLQMLCKNCNSSKLPEKV